MKNVENKLVFQTKFYYMIKVTAMTNFLLVLIIILHLWFLIFEMFLWRTKLARKTFKMSQELADSSAILAKNQGLYNGFLVAGLVWSMMTNDSNLAFQLKLFFLSCISLAGIFGAITASLFIFFLQAMPSLLALIILFL